VHIYIAISIIVKPRKLSGLTNFFLFCFSAAQNATSAPYITEITVKTNGNPVGTPNTGQVMIPNFSDDFPPKSLA